jgi:glycine/D-amino acid oxidase-like deaminating enzyme
MEDVPASKVPAFPRYRGDRAADVVVIGGGLTGCAAAYLCAAAGLDVVLLDQDRIGRGRTSRSAGMLTPNPGPSFRAISAAHGLKAARHAFELWRRGVLEGAALLRRLRVNCFLEGRETLIVAAGLDERELRREHDARRAAGFDLAWLTRTQLQSRMRLESAGGLKIRDGFMLNAYRACIGLAAAAARAGASCHERSRVKKVRFTRKHADVIVDGGTIRTTKVIVATATATDEYRSLKRHFDRREAYLVLTEPVPAAVRRQLGKPDIIVRDSRVPATQFGWTHDGRLLIAGGDQPATPERTRSAVLVQRTGQLMYELLTAYPAISGLRPEYGWEAPYGRTADGLMYIGAHRNYPHHLFALGGSSVSITGSFVAARILARGAQGTTDRGDEVFGWTR